MAYIGRQPQIGNFQICDAISTVNNQAAYTMQVGSVNVSPESANHMIVSLNGVIQKPNSSYTVAGAVITFASNLVTGDVINFIQILGSVLDLGVPSDDTVTAAKLSSNAVTTVKILDANVTLAKLSATGTKNSTTFLRGDNTFNAPPLGGITEADMFRLTADITGTDADITANLERCDDASFGKIGTGMSESSGIFTFPSTGIYQVVAEGTFINGSGVTEASMDVYIYVTTNNSTYDAVANIQNGVPSGTQAFQSGMKSCFVDVTDTSNVKVKFATSSLSSGSQLKGDTAVNKTCFTFIRLGDT